MKRIDAIQKRILALIAQREAVKGAPFSRFLLHLDDGSTVKTAPRFIEALSRLVELLVHEKHRVLSVELSEGFCSPKESALFESIALGGVPVSPERAALLREGDSFPSPPQKPSEKAEEPVANHNLI